MCMFRNYLKTAIRNLKRNKLYAIINVLGMAVGIAACLLIFLVIQFETSFDKFHPNRANIYRVVTEFHSQDGISYSKGISFPVAPALRLDFPEIKKVAGVFRSYRDEITLQPNSAGISKKFIEDFYFAEPQFFSIFNFPLLAGDIRTVLREPHTAIITQELAEKYFGDWKSAIGKTIKRNNNNNEVFTVTGILKNIPNATDFPLTIVGSYATLQYT